jgi:hypothetical protein
MPAFSRAEYEKLIYSLAEHYPDISSSTLHLYTHSATTALVRGSLYFRKTSSRRPRIGRDLSASLSRAAGH